MNALVGHAALWLGIIAAAAAIGSSFAAAARMSGSLLRVSAVCVIVAASATLAAGGALVRAFLCDDMRVEYVADHSARAMSPLLKVAAWWAGQEGSLLLWTCLTALVTVGVVCTRRGSCVRSHAASTLAGTCVLAFGLLVVALAANPFVSAGSAAVDGQGLHPLLRHWAMVLHPPVLFCGYALSVAPLAILIGGVVGGRPSTEWSAAVRPWVLASWLALGAGMTLGAWWAYVQLGWGGYWAWDPVENSSLQPWLTSAALYHTLMLVRRGGGGVRWATFLTGATSTLCLLGMALTRSGLVQSVHAFGRTTVGPMFLGAALVMAAGLAGVVWKCRKRVFATHAATLTPRDGVVLLLNVVLLMMTALTFLGNLIPVAGRMIGGRSVAMSAGYYNRLVLPLGLFAVALMVIASLISKERVSKSQLTRAAVLPALAAAFSCLTLVACHVREPAAFASAAVVAPGLVVGLQALKRSIRAARPASEGDAHGESLLAARKLGSCVAHLGVLALVIGIAGSGLFAREQSLTLSRGQMTRAGDRAVRLVDVRESRGQGCNTIEADIEVFDAGGCMERFHPCRTFYDFSQEVGAQPAIHCGAVGDVYVALVGWEAGGTQVAVQLRTIPLTIWIWIGTVAMTLGGALCLVPVSIGRLASRRASRTRERARHAPPDVLSEARA